MENIKNMKTVKKHFLKKSVKKKHFFKKNIKLNIKLKSLKKNKKKIVLLTNLTLLNKFNPAITNPGSINSIIIKPTSFNQAITNPASIHYCKNTF